MATTKNLCAQISLDLHQKISEAREAAGLTTAQYITELLTEYFKMKESGGNITMTNNNTRTLAFQISEKFFQRIKAHLERETQRTGRKLTQREFVLGLIEEALEAAERQTREASPNPEEEIQEEAGANPCEAQSGGDAPQPLDTPSQGGVEPCEAEGSLHDSREK